MIPSAAEHPIFGVELTAHKKNQHWTDLLPCQQTWDSFKASRRDVSKGGIFPIWTRPSRFAPSCPFSDFLRDKFLHRGFCTSENRIWARILGNEFWAPEFWTRIPGSNFLSLLFPAKEAPRKIHPQEIHLSKFNPEIGPKNSHCTSAGPFD